MYGVCVLPLVPKGNITLKYIWQLLGVVFVTTAVIYLGLPLNVYM